MNNLIAVCIFGKEFNQEKILVIESKTRSLFPNSDQLVFFHDFTNPNPLRNLFNVSYKKQKYEFERKIFFTGCLALSIDDDRISQELITSKEVDLFSQLDKNTLYFLTGSMNLSTIYKCAYTSIDPLGFFTNSFLFDLACNFVNVNSTFETDRNEPSPSHIGERFYWYLKTLKIKTHCINYENRSLFKRPA